MASRGCFVARTKGHISAYPPPHIIYSILIFLLVSAYEFLIELFNDVSSMGNFKIYLIYHFFSQRCGEALNTTRQR